MIKYPSTPYLELLPSRLVPQKWDFLLGRNPVVITEKMDGENTSLHSSAFHARSLDSRHHASRDYAKSIWARVKHKIPSYLQVFCENMYAIHSIKYKNLTNEDSLLVFNIYDKEHEEFLRWKDVEAVTYSLGLMTVPILAYFNKGLPRNLIPDHPELMVSNSESYFGGEREGIVIRVQGSFGLDMFETCVVKYVRPNHVQTDIHWTRKWQRQVGIK